MFDFDFLEWDEDDDPRGNIQHIALNGLVPEEVEDVLLRPGLPRRREPPDGGPARFGWTLTGKHIIVVHEITTDSGISVLRPVTAYEVESGS